MVEVIAFASAKGGTGKTSLAASIGKMISSLGYRVALIDLDSVTNGLTLLLLGDVIQKSKAARMNAYGIFEAIGEPADPVEISDNLWLVPASYKLFDSSQVNLNQIEFALEMTLESTDKQIDYIIIDTEPGTDELTKFAVKNSDKVVIVTEFDPLSKRAIDSFQRKMLGILDQENTYFLVNKMLPEKMTTFSDPASLSVFALRGLLPPLPFDFEVMRAYSDGEVPLRLDKPTPYSTGILLVMESLLPNVRREIQEYRKQRKELELEPARKTLSDLRDRRDKLIESMVKSKKSRNRQRESQNLSLLTMAVLFGALGFAFIAVYGTTGRINELSNISVIVASLGAVIASLYVRTFYTGRNRQLEEKESVMQKSFEARLDLIERQIFEYETLLETQKIDAYTTGHEQPSTKGSTSQQ